jgi:DNA gyrase subunit B
MAEKWREFYHSNDGYRLKTIERLDQAQRKYWADESHRRDQSERTRKYFAQHPEAKAKLALHAAEEWSDPMLREWRREKTKEQWTSEFRARRLASLHQTYYRKTMAALKQIEINPVI